jgi:Carboxypeptidase regulatory-like domain
VPASSSDFPDVSQDGVVAGRVTAGGHPVEDAVVMIVEGHSSHPDLAAITDATGRFQLGGLMPGWYNFEARDGQRSARQSVELTTGARAWIEFAMATPDAV